MAVVGLLLEGPETAVLALCHDMAECIIGDITPHCKVNNGTAGELDGALGQPRWQQTSPSQIQSLTKSTHLSCMLFMLSTLLNYSCYLCKCKYANITYVHDKYH